jgi:integrase
MSVRTYSRNGGWYCDIRIVWPGGERYRERVKAPVTGRSNAERWGREHEAALLRKGQAEVLTPSAPIPTLGEFWPRVLRDHYLATRKKTSTVEDVERIFRNQLSGWAKKPLDKFTDADVAKLKGELSDLSAKRVNNVLSVLSVILTSAVKWKVLKGKPCDVGLLPIHKRKMPWYEVDVYRTLVKAAARLSSNHHVLVLLMGSAGLRRGEVIALRWKDVDFKRGVLNVENAVFRGVEDSPKGGRGRLVPMTKELKTTLEAHPHVEGEDGEDRVLYTFKGAPLTRASIRWWIYEIEREAGMEETGRAHIFRHSFCSHLALAGAPTKAIQEIAGHAHLSTTEKYMHLSPLNREKAIGLLDGLQTEGE